MFKRKPRYRHAGLQAGSNQPLFRRRIVSTAAVAQNPPHRQFLFIALNHVVSTSVKWTLHAKTRSMQKGAAKFALTLKQKLVELQVTHEYREKLKAEREERAEMARAAREEQKLLRDMERAEEEENRYLRLLDKAKSDANEAAADQIGAYDEKIRMLEKDLADAHAKFERAQAMAEKTRSGYVYIISNIGSFGEEVVKIGLTRRLDPADRVRELGDAGVPFVFDTHAIIYSDDAPALERALHNEFQKTRINAQNFRKEFFRVSIDEVERAVARLAPGAPFFKDVEAQEYRETLARRNAMLAAVEPIELVAFPASI
ncbi:MULTISPECIES: GIY-YIG nuclease family protein [Rhizobium]|uniref:Flagellar biosynthesis GTPase FlhF n=5 Tax=Rhizobium TaxID=379 RepID=A0A1C3X8J3_9HYPH|nr:MULTISPECIES: GIY-YIG nuclease family protein [Rhizobium]MBB4245060.1 flagellar biosynthesis GTPase FlhF [Rhizobium tropici]MBB4569988.1 flagellar biosynthesis GTPase FlhF [Rhizobium leucaenae]MBB5576329.1 flagellar biosynthesis GTPase FlhF [Rhizobium paranaense]MBB5596408.1 flagellar biosynthesis GTPase FlhF [Rhizobium tropici]MBB6489210.1 flagellar biosynthesis GTPase FlhF [Rhizobium lusitanum]